MINVKAFPFARCPAGPTDAVNVGIRRIGNVEIDDVGHLVTSIPRAADVGGHQNLELAGAKSVQSGLTSGLGQVAPEGEVDRNPPGKAVPPDVWPGVWCGWKTRTDSVSVRPKKIQKQFGLQCWGTGKSACRTVFGRSSHVHLDRDRVPSTSWANALISSGMVAENIKVWRRRGRWRRIRRMSGESPCRTYDPLHPGPPFRPAPGR